VGWSLRIPPPIHRGIPHSSSSTCDHRHMAPKAKVSDQPVNVRLPKELHEAVLSRATEDDRTMAQIIRVALRYYLQETKPHAAA
jgi:predicted HicB family RNase H-like nuclease